MNAVTNGSNDSNGSKGKVQTPLVTACELGGADVVQALLSGGAEVNRASRDGTTPLLAGSGSGLGGGGDGAAGGGAGRAGRGRQGAGQGRCLSLPPSSPHDALRPELRYEKLQNVNFKHVMVWDVAPVPPGRCDSRNMMPERKLSPERSVEACLISVRVQISQRLVLCT